MTKASLFDSFVMGPVTLKNRLVMNPMTRCRAGADAVPTEIMATYYAQRASAGLIVTEGVAPSPNGRGYARIPGLWNDDQVTAWKKVTGAVKAKGGVIFAQIMHTGRVSHPANQPAGARIVAPSAIALPGQTYTDSLGMQDYPVPEAMTEADIAQAKAEFVAAARNAIAAGFDGVELHGANGYLLEQFLNPHINQRTDAWGGSVAKRIRFVVEVAEAVAAAIGGDRTGIRISPFGAASGMPAYPEVEETYLALMGAFAKAGLVYVHMADHAGMGGPGPSHEFKRAIRNAWPNCLMIGGSLDATSAAKVLDEGLADLVGFGRSFLANPDFVARVRDGKPLNAPNFDLFYTPGEVGYTDYPTAA